MWEKKKVLIADDEQYICDLIAALIDWKERDLELLGKVKDGNLAYEYCSKYRPDILITDIRMPGLSGIELIRKLYENYPEIKIIIITGFSQFSYVHQALRFGIVDYLLKPIQKTELDHALEKCLDIIEKNSISEVQKQKFTLKSMQDFKDSLLSLVLQKGNQCGRSGNYSHLLKEYHLQFEGNGWMLLQIEFILNRGDNSYCVQDYLGTRIKYIVKNEFENVEILTAYMNNSFYCLFNSEINQLDKVRKNLMRLKTKLVVINDVLQKINFTIGVSSIYNSFEHIDVCIDECRKCIEYKILMGKNKVIRYEEIPTNEFQVSFFINEQYRTRFLESVAEADGDALIADIDSLMTSLYRYSSKIDGGLVLETYKIITELFYSGIQVFHLDLKNFTKESILAQKEFFYSISSAFAYLSDIFQLLIKDVREEKEKQNTRPIRLAQLFIEEHYMDQITLEDVSKYVALNDTYLSTIFKKQVGKSVVDYVTYVRIQHAKDLLADKNKTVNNIAEEVGFNDPKYFTKRFKKYTGLSPNEYRKLFF